MTISARRRRNPSQMPINLRSQWSRRSAWPWCARNGPSRTQTFSARGGKRDVCRSMAVFAWVQAYQKSKHTWINPAESLAFNYFSLILFLTSWLHHFVNIFFFLFFFWSFIYNVSIVLTWFWLISTSSYRHLCKYNRSDKLSDSLNYFIPTISAQFHQLMNGFDNNLSRFSGW